MMNIFLILIIVLSVWQGFDSTSGKALVKGCFLSDGSKVLPEAASNPFHTFKTNTIIAGNDELFGAVFVSSGKIKSAPKFTFGAVAPEVRSGFT